MDPAQNAALPGPWSTLRPLSDIRETTESSLLHADLACHLSGRKKRGKVPIDLELGRLLNDHAGTSIVPHPSQRGDGGRMCIQLDDRLPDGVDATAVRQPAIFPESQTDRSSRHSVSLENLPRRSHSRSRNPSARHSSESNNSSRGILAHNHANGGQRRDAQAPRLWSHAYAVPHRGVADPPVKEVASRMGKNRSARRYPPKSEGAVVPKTRTLIRTQDPNTDVLEFPSHRHPRVSVALQLGANLFVGGGTIEGRVRVVVNEHADRGGRSRMLAIGRMSIDLLGVEEQLTGAGAPRRSVFINLTTEMLGAESPPPKGMVESPKQISPLDPFWLLAMSTSNVQFLLSLPLDVGPPPYHTKHARIRYMLAVTVLIRDQGKQYLVRASQDIVVISVYDRK
jgi:hypothetical protein